MPFVLLQTTLLYLFLKNIPNGQEQYSLRFGGRVPILASLKFSTRVPLLRPLHQTLVSFAFAVTGHIRQAEKARCRLDFFSKRRLRQVGVCLLIHLVWLFNPCPTAASVTWLTLNLNIVNSIHDLSCL